MAKAVQLFLVIAALLAGFFSKEVLGQRQICSYYGMNLLSSFCDGYFAQVVPF